jgi:hypothetical protein
MSKTRTQVLHRAIKELGMLPLDGETFPSVDELIDGLVVSLRERQIVDILDIENLEDELFQPVAQCLAYAAFPEMGITDKDTIARLAAQKEQAEHDIQIIVAGVYTGKTLQVCYY